MNKILLIFFIIFLYCSAEPTQIDVDRVVKNFLELRFQSQLSKQNISDYELFLLSCKNQRVNCNKVLKILEKEKPDFYKILIESK